MPPSRVENSEIVEEEEEMPRTRRRHHSRDRSSAGTREKRRRLDTGDLSPPLAEAPSPPRLTKTHHTRSAAKRRRHELDANSSHISKEPTHGLNHGRNNSNSISISIGIGISYSSPLWSRGCVWLNQCRIL
ncbi:hypothetical protein AWZ03_001252 [Drosophila navojoa]|uniref:Uncharacterized protein n=1 Tax=Drosophila navojoa TaxID=7232 RepID=A0A484BWN7_DRONA|nr:hypothetical protein AWZ03_001252 [Drosophila navojoa]